MLRARSRANLSDSLHGQLNMYALAATAAGVGVLALAEQAEGTIFVCFAGGWQKILQ